jgi:hypothetical protein
VTWFNPETGATKAGELVSGGGSVRLVSPLESKDALVWLKRATAPSR